MLLKLTSFDSESEVKPVHLMFTLRKTLSLGWEGTGREGGGRGGGGGRGWEGGEGRAMPLARRKGRWARLDELELREPIYFKQLPVSNNRTDDTLSLVSLVVTKTQSATAREKIGFSLLHSSSA